MAAKAKQGEVSAREQRQAYNKSVYGTNIPSATAKKKQEEQLTKRRLFDTAIESGATEEEAAAEVKGSGIGSVTPRLDQAAYAESQRQAGAGAASPESGDKYLRVKQLVRKFKGQAPLAETPEQFASQLEASKGFGAESALLTGAGRARATESAIASGLSPAEAQSQINTAADVLRSARDKGKITKGLMESVTPDYGVGVFKSADKTTPKAAVPAPYAFQGPPESAKPKVGVSATPRVAEVDEETALPEKPSDLIKSLVGELSLDRSTAAKISQPAYVLSRFTGYGAKPLAAINPALQAARYQTDEDFRQQQIEDTIAANEKGLAYTIGRAVVKGNPLNPLANPVPVLASILEAPLEVRNQLLAKKLESKVVDQMGAASSRRINALKEARQKLISDEDWRKLPPKEAVKYTQSAKDILMAAREARNTKR